jgi:hypothetical protein
MQLMKYHAIGWVSNKKSPAFVHKIAVLAMPAPAITGRGAVFCALWLAF